MWKGLDWLYVALCCFSLLSGERPHNKRDPKPHSSKPPTIIMQTNWTIHNFCCNSTIDGLRKSNENPNLHLHGLLGTEIVWRSDLGQAQVSNTTIWWMANDARVSTHWGHELIRLWREEMWGLASVAWCIGERTSWWWRGMMVGCDQCD